jgi:hypothetical protein
VNLDVSSENTLLFCYRELELVEKYKNDQGGSGSSKGISIGDDMQITSAKILANGTSAGGLSK